MAYSYDGGMSLAYEEILQKAGALSPDEQLRLISQLAERLQRGSSQERRTSILELQGLGKEIWEGIDPREYIQRERNSWNG